MRLGDAVRWLTAACALALVGTPLAAYAQGNAPGDVPSYARPAAHSDEESIRGRIESIDGKYVLQVRDDRGYVDNVMMHQGTIINPTGISLAPGMSVTILGYNRGRYFDANEIDTPYTVSYAYPYPVYPYPYPYYYPPGIVIAPRFGFHWR